MSSLVNKNKIRRWIDARYGSRRGLMLTVWHRLLYLLGRYRPYKNVDWQSIERLVFVCKANICRSAYAEAYARSLGIEAISCGVLTSEDAPADEHAILAARQRGISLEGHKSTPIMYLILRKTDLLVAVEPWQADLIARNLIRKHYCTLLGLWSRPALPHIHDPYGSSPAYFQQCFARIEQSVYGLAKKIKK